MSFARVEQFVHHFEGAVATGYAVPEPGPRSAAIALYAGDTLVHVAQASRFSAVAHARGKRLGWCGFMIPATTQAFALSPRVTLRCHATGRTLAKVGRDLLAASIDREQGPADIFAMLAEARRETDATSVTQILSFAEAHAQIHGAENLVDACYRMILGRAPDPSALQDWIPRAQFGNIAADLLVTLEQSAEFRGNRRLHVPGPFHPNFRLTLAPLL